MATIKTISQGTETPADNVRRQIGEAEILVANLKGAGARTLTLLELLDQIDAGLAQLQPTGMDIRAEESRLQTLQSILRKKKGILLREMRSLGGLAQARASRQPAAEQWWWFLDAAQAAERRRALRRYLTIAGVVVLLGAIAVIVYQRFFRPDPLTLAIYANQTAAQRFMSAGQWQDAAPLLEANMALAPAEAEWPIRLGVAKTLLGEASAGAALFQQGQQLAGDELTFLLLRGQMYIEVSDFVRAGEDMRRATEANPESATAYYYLGRALAGLNDRPAALEAYERASRLAQQEKGSEMIYVMARLELANLLQVPGSGGTATP